MIRLYKRGPDPRSNGHDNGDSGDIYGDGNAIDE